MNHIIKVLFYIKYICAPSLHALRLHAELVPLVTHMEESYEKLAHHLTELKMDHDEGKRESEDLTKLLIFHV